MEQCTKDGQLEALRDGTIGASPLTGHLRCPQLQKEEGPITEAANSIAHDLSSSGTSVHVGTLRLHESGQKKATINPSASDPRATDICRAIEKINSPEVKNRVFTIKLSPKPYDTHGGQGHESPQRMEPSLAQIKSLEDQHQDQQENYEPDTGMDQDSGSDGGVILNLHGSEQESGEISETNSQVLDNGRDDDRVADESENGQICQDNENDSGDAMMDYARSDGAKARLKPIQDNSSTFLIQRDQPRTLAEITPEELKAQLRYFHITKRPSDVDRTTLVKCLICAEESHMAEACNKKPCTACGIPGVHFSQQCPLNWRCHNCQELGHDVWKCPNTGRYPPTTHKLCDLCHLDGHDTVDCELLWRTSGLSWESTGLVNKSVRLSCYECGKNGHLGNDCSTRRPGKPLGTSTWSSGPTGQITIKSQGEMTIKGRARQRKPTATEDSDDEQANFYRPRVPEPARNGQIRIKTGGSSNFSNRGPDLYTKDDQPYRNDRNASSRGGGYRDNTRDEGYRNDTGQYRYRPSDRRSLSPRSSKPFSGRGNGNFKNHPRQLQERSPAQGGERPSQVRGSGRGAFYRPMPSTAQNAWAKHRI